MNLINLIPSSDDIIKIKAKINKREEKYFELVKCLNEWKEKVIYKIENLKKNLKYEIELMKKMFYNYNTQFINYTYFFNFDYFTDYIEDRNSMIFEKCYKLKPEK